MDNRRFDDLTRSLAGAPSRRQLLKRVVAVLIGAGGATARAATSTSAHQRPESCETFCRENLPPQMQERCIEAGLQGQGPCAECGPDSDGTWLLCGTTCVDPSTDLENCGACGNVCPDSPLGLQADCRGGVCTTVPDAGQGECGYGRVSCDGNCVDLSDDPDHCGDCAIACSEFQLCAYGHCCVDHAFRCSADTECCSGICSNVNGSGETYCCLLLGSACSIQGQCCVSDCEDGVCCKSLQRACTTHTECCSGMCDGYHCCVPRGQACAAGTDCCWGHDCVDGRCCTASVYECSSHVECCTGSCEDGRCCLPHGSTCTYSLECCEGVCDDSGTCVCLPAGAACNEDDISPCCAGNCNDGECCLPQNRACSADDECCAPWTCNDGVCTCKTIGEICDDTGQCCSGSCQANEDGSASICCIGIGSYCQDTADCCSGTCRGNQCQLW